jgi:hypothetical protein
MPPVFAAMLNVKVPSPLPLAPPVIDIHDALLAADHSHPAGAVTDSELASVPDAATVIFRGLTA